MRRVRRVGATALLAGVALTAVTAAVPRTASAQEDDDATRLEFGALSLTLLDHSIDVGPNGDISLVYRIDGDLADAELLAIDQRTERPPDPDPDDTIDEEGGAEPEPEPVPISVDVIVDDRLDEVADLIGKLGPAASQAAFPSPFDGVLFPDVRPSITVGDDGQVILRLDVPTDVSPSEADRIGLDDPGIYPLLVSLRVDDIVVARHGTVVNRVDAVPTAATVGLTALAAVPQPTTLVDDAELAALTDDAARITEFAEVAEVPLTLSIPPRVVDALTVGTSAGAIVASSLRDDSLQSLPATPFDVSAAVAIERDDAFVRQLTIGEEQLQSAVPGTPVRRDVWLVDRPLSGDAAALLRTLGVRLLVMTEEVARSMIDGLPAGVAHDRLLPLSLPDGSTLPVLLLDHADSPFTPRATIEVLREQTPVEWAVDHLARLRLGLEDDERDGVDALEPRGRIVAGPDLGPLDPRLLNELVRLDARTRIIDVVEASALVSTVASQSLAEAVTLPETAGPSLVERVDTIQQTGLVLLDAASMLPDDDVRRSSWVQLLDSLVSTAYTDDDVDDVVSNLLDEADRLTSSIVPPEPFSITLTSRRETIPVEITNTADEPLRVRIELTSQRLAFPEGDPEVVLAPSSTTEIEIPVEARSNGTTSVEVRIVTPTGGELTEPVRISTRVQSLSGLAQLLTATLVILLLTWWFNNWRQRRRGGDDADGTTDDTTHDTTGSPDPTEPGDDADGRLGSVSG